MKTLYEEEGNGFIKIRWDDKLQVWIMHLDCKSWSVSEFKRYKQVFKIVCADLKSKGISEVYGLCADKKAVKFNRMFGAKLTGDVVTIDDGSIRTIIKMET